MIDYLLSLARENRLARELDFRPCTFSGINYLEGLLQQFRDAGRLFAVSDVCDENLIQRGGSWIKRRVFTVYILSCFDPGDMDDYNRALGETRELYRQVLSRLLHDEGRMQGRLLYLDLSSVKSQELGGMFLNGATGLYFVLRMDQPIDISYNAENWITPAADEY